MVAVGGLVGCFGGGGLGFGRLAGFGGLVVFGRRVGCVVGVWGAGLLGGCFFCVVCFVGGGAFAGGDGLAGGVGLLGGLWGRRRLLLRLRGLLLRCVVVGDLLLALELGGLLLLGGDVGDGGGLLLGGLLRFLSCFLGCLLGFLLGGLLECLLLGGFWGGGDG